MIFKTQSDFLEKIDYWGFSTNPLIKKVKNLNEIEKKIVIYFINKYIMVN